MDPTPHPTDVVAVGEDTDPIRVAPFMLTDTHASEHIYGQRLRDGMADLPIAFVDDWRDADVAHMFEVNLFTRAAVTEAKFLELWRLLRSDVPVVVSTDDLYFTGDPSLTSRPWLYRPNRRVQRWLFDRSDAVIAISDSVRSRIEPSIDDTPVHVVHHGVDERYFEAATEPPDPYVLHVSLAAPRKNPAAIAAVAERLDARFVLAGSGWDEHVPEHSRPANVEVLGYVPEDQLRDLYGRAAVFYFPTLHEGFGLPVLEAMASRAAVVSSNAYSVPEVADETALLSDPHDVEAHLAAIRDLLADEQQRRTLADAAQRRARTFTWEETARSTAAVYRSVIA